MTPKVVKLRRVNPAEDAARLEDIADWIDQTVGYGTDQAEQLRAFASSQRSLAIAYAARDRLEQERDDHNRSFGTHLSEAKDILRDK